MKYNDTIEHYGVKGMKWGKRKKSLMSKIYDNHVENIKYNYRKKGYSEEEIEKKTKRRLKLEKSALIVAGAVAAGYSAYLLKNNVENNYTGFKLKEGTKISSVTGSDKMDLNRRFYGSHSIMDKKKYQGLYAKQRPDLDKVAVLRAKKEVKVPSHRQAKKIFDELYTKDSKFREDFDYLDKSIYRPIGYRKKNNYDTFNVALVDDRFGNSKEIHDKFYSKLKQKGYSGVLDVNDTKYSGFKSKKPVIYFDGKNALEEQSVNPLEKDHVDKQFNKYIRAQIATSPTLYGVGVGSAVYTHRKNNRKRKVDEPQNKKNTGEKDNA